MSNKKGTKRALLGSILAMVLCLAMLMGTTFAWFTDSAATTVNNIQAGTLDIELVDENNAPITGPLTWKKAAEGAGQTVLWEPGCTYDLQSFKIVNKGNLALKYKIEITGIDGDAELNEVIDWTYKIGEAEADLSVEGKLAAGGETGLITITGKMQETAGNQYQDKYIDGVTITVYATQDTVEFDSTTNEYDKGAIYALNAATTDAISQAINAGENVSLSDNVTYTYDDKTFSTPGVSCILSDTVIDLNGKTLKGSISDWNPCSITINGSEGSVCTYAEGDDKVGLAVWAYNAGTQITINGGTFIGAPGASCIYAFNGDVVINGGYFKTEGMYNGKYYVLNQYNSGAGQITVYGGTFENYNPAWGDDTDATWGTNATTGGYVAEGYHVISEIVDDTTTIYTVVAD